MDDLKDRHQDRLSCVLALGAALLVCAAPATALAHPGSGPSEHRLAGTATLHQQVTTREVAGQRVRVATHADPRSVFTRGPLHGRAPYTETEAPGESAGPVPALGSVYPEATCQGVLNGDDDTAHAVNSAPLVKVIYAYTTDTGNRFATYAPVIEATIRADYDKVAAAAADKSIRYDLGTAEAPGCVDIQTIALPRTESEYLSPVSGTTFSLLTADLKAALGGSAALGTRDFLVFADKVAPPSIGGQGSVYLDDSFAGASHNLGGLFAVLYGRGGTDFFGSGFTYPSGTTSTYGMQVALHESTHNLGGVQNSAPDASGALHCTDEWDIMCYSDGGPNPLLSPPPCASPPGPYSASNEAWDCGMNDYMNPDPLAGSYLATHWNVYRSSFLCNLDNCAPPDLTAPNTTITSGPSGTTTSASVNFGFSSTESGSFECQLDGGAYAACSSPQGYGGLADGAHTFAVRATDLAGNVDATPASRSFTVQTPPPAARARVSVAGNTLTVMAAPGATDNLRIARAGTDLRITDQHSGRFAGSDVDAGAGCLQGGTASASCQASGITSIRILAGDQGDQVMNATLIASTLNGGAGNDFLIGGAANDTLIGGAGADQMTGMNGRDQLKARDLTSDNRINCDGGAHPDRADVASLDRLPKDRAVSGCESQTRL